MAKGRQRASVMRRMGRARRRERGRGGGGYVLVFQRMFRLPSAANSINLEDAGGLAATVIVRDNNSWKQGRRWVVGELPVIK